MIVKDGAKQEIETGRFCVYTSGKTSQLSLGFIVGFTAKRVKVEETFGFGGPANKTFERIIQVPDEIAESMNKRFFKQIKESYPNL